MKLIFLYIILLFCSCDSSDSESENQLNIIDNWLISEVTSNGNLLPFSDCTSLENITFYEGETFAWQLYAVTNQYDCVPIPATNGTWEYLSNGRAQLTDDDVTFEVTFTETTLTMNFEHESTEANPDGIHVIFVFLRS